jgi:hypothetical protein
VNTSLMPILYKDTSMFRHAHSYWHFGLHHPRSFCSLSFLLFPYRHSHPTSFLIPSVLLAPYFTTKISTTIGVKRHLPYLSLLPSLERVALLMMLRGILLFYQPDVDSLVFHIAITYSFPSDTACFR